MARRQYEENEWGDDFREDRKREKTKGVREQRTRARESKMYSGLTEKETTRYDETDDN